MWSVMAPEGATVVRVALTFARTSSVRAGQPRIGTFSPASTAKGSVLAAGGSGQVAKSVYAQGMLYARLKSIATLPSDDTGAVTSCRRAEYVVTPEVASRNRIHTPPSSPSQATRRCSVPSWSKTTSPTASPSGAAYASNRAGLTHRGSAG